MSQTAKEIIAANVQALIAQLNEGKSEALTAYLNAMSSFHSYSFGNIMQIARQRPDASRVAGFNAWKALGRNVKKGEKGIQILAPMIGKKKTETEGAGEENTKAIYGFRAVYVFDVTQTEGAELPAISSHVQGEVGAHLVQLRGFAESQAIAIEYAENIAPALGMSYGGKIAYPAGSVRS